MTMGSTLVLHRKFKPATVLEDIPQTQGDRPRGRSGDAVPDARRAGEDADQARPVPRCGIIFVSGSQLGAELATRAMKDIGPVVYNLYGSTEIAFVSIARPQDLKKNPATVGPTIKGVKVKILDEHGKRGAHGSGRLDLRRATSSRSRATPAAAARRSSTA